MRIRIKEPLFLLSRSTVRAQSNQNKQLQQKEILCKIFTKKYVDLDFIHDMEINKTTDFYLKVKKEPQMSEK